MGLKTIVSSACALVVCLAGSSALAQEGEDYRTQTESDGYSVEFFVDKLSGSDLEGGSALIRGSFKPVRMMFMRPRVSFMPELRKSVEAL
jgi:hypothetical protein